MVFARARTCLGQLLPDDVKNKVGWDQGSFWGILTETSFSPE